MAGITEPVPRALLAVLRRAVADHVRTEPRRSTLPLLHVGWPGGREDVVTADPAAPLDHALRTDVIAALLRRGRAGAPVPGGVPLVWLTRPGPLFAGDVDLTWLSSALAATAEAGIDLTMVVVTRQGWHDPRTGVRREWKRMRVR